MTRSAVFRVFFFLCMKQTSPPFVNVVFGQTYPNQSKMQSIMVVFALGRACCVRLKGKGTYFWLMQELNQKFHQQHETSHHLRDQCFRFDWPDHISAYLLLIALDSDVTMMQKQASVNMPEFPNIQKKKKNKERQTIVVVLWEKLD